MASEAGENPILHSTDGDIFHFPGFSFDVYQATLLTKYMFLNLVAAGLTLACFFWLRSNLRRFGFPKGGLFNLLEALLLYVRNDVAAPAIGKKDVDKFMPFLWTVFFFVLFGNLLGMLPWLGSPTGALGTNVALALCTFILVHGTGIKENGLADYAKSFVPHGVPTWVLPILVPIELMSHLLRPCILAFRLFVNMLAGHTVLYVFLTFTQGVKADLMGGVITVGSVGAVVILSFLEFLVAFIQAYVFTFLSSLYIGGAIHPHH
jgi:F-type H+-transporting ATPase subunit a